MIKLKQWWFVFLLFGLVVGDYYVIHKFNSITKLNTFGKTVEGRIVSKSSFKGSWTMWVEYQYLNRTYKQTVRLSSEKMKEYRDKNLIKIKFLPSKPSIITCDDDKTINLLILWFVLINFQIWRYGKRLIKSFRAQEVK